MMQPQGAELMRPDAQDDRVGTYHRNARGDLLRLIPPGVRHVLDVGCGAGKLGEALKRRNSAIRVVGIELNDEAASSAETILDRVIRGRAEEVALESLGPPFDCIIFGDVLEHMVDPWSELQRFAAQLSEDGTIAASIPNVAHWTVIAGLLRGKWEYRDRGLLDRTHLRFFTRASIGDLFTRAGLVISHCERNYRLREADRRYARVAQWLARGPLRDLLTFQYLIRAGRRGR